MTIVSIHQPIYLPWLSYFDKIRRSDIHVVLDHVTCGKADLCNRNKIRTPTGYEWLTIPVKNKGSQITPIRCIEFADQKKDWRKSHMAAIRENYKKAPLWEKHRIFFEILYTEPFGRLYPLLAFVHGYLFSEFDICPNKIVSSYRIPHAGTKSLMNLNICKELGATKYLSGPFGRNYLDIKSFNDAGIEVEFTDFKHPVYQQCQPGEFIPGMSAIDAMLNGYRFPDV